MPLDTTLDEAIALARELCLTLEAVVTRFADEHAL